MDLTQDPTLFLVFCISCFILYLGVKSLVGRGNLPPGPMPLPLLGNALDIGVDIVNSLMKLREKYGDVFMVYLGSRPVVVVTGYNLVKEIYLDKGDDYLNRGSLPTWHESYRNHGFIFTNNMERWKELRRFSLSAFRGFGKRSIEDLIQEETGYLLAELKKSKGVIHEEKNRANFFRKTLPRLSPGCVRYYNLGPFTSMELSCNTKNNLETDVALFWKEISSIFLILDNPFKDQADFNLKDQAILCKSDQCPFTH